MPKLSHGRSRKSHPASHNQLSDLMKGLLSLATEFELWLVEYSWKRVTLLRLATSIKSIPLKNRSLLTKPSQFSIIFQLYCPQSSAMETHSMIGPYPKEQMASRQHTHKKGRGRMMWHLLPAPGILLFRIPTLQYFGVFFVWNIYIYRCIHKIHTYIPNPPTHTHIDPEPRLT